MRATQVPASKSQPPEQGAFLQSSRRPLVGQQPSCVNCGELLDVWAQWLCDQCRMLPLYVVIWGMPLVEAA